MFGIFLDVAVPLKHILFEVVSSTPIGFQTEMGVSLSNPWLGAL